MIEAVLIESDWASNLLRFAFKATSDDGEARFYANFPSGGQAWVPRSQLAAVEGFGVAQHVAGDELKPTPVIVALPHDVAAALAEGILTVTQGMPATDMRALRRDLEHERSQRDRLQDVVTEIALHGAGVKKSGGR